MYRSANDRVSSFPADDVQIAMRLEGKERVCDWTKRAAIAVAAVCLAATSSCVGEAERGSGAAPGGGPGGPASGPVGIPCDA